MTDTIPPVPLTLTSRVDQAFPMLTSAQIARIAMHGQVRHVQRGEVLMEAGEQTPRFFVVTAGHIAIVRPSGVTEELVVVLRPGQFTGEVTMLSGRRGLVRIRAGEAGAVVEHERDYILALVQTDGELSEILLRAFILRRVELIAHGFGDSLCSVRDIQFPVNFLHLTFDLDLAPVKSCSNLSIRASL